MAKTAKLRHSPQTARRLQLAKSTHYRRIDAEMRVIEPGGDGDQFLPVYILIGCAGAKTSIQICTLEHVRFGMQAELHLPRGMPTLHGKITDCVLRRNHFLSGGPKFIYWLEITLDEDLGPAIFNSGVL